MLKGFYLVAKRLSFEETDAELRWEKENEKEENRVWWYSKLFSVHSSAITLRRIDGYIVVGGSSHTVWYEILETSRVK